MCRTMYSALNAPNHSAVFLLSVSPEATKRYNRQGHSSQPAQASRTRKRWRKDFRPFIAKLIEEAPSLKALPLFLGHLDMNEMNVLVGGDAEIMVVVD